MLIVLSCPGAPTDTVLLLPPSVDPPPIETEFLPVDLGSFLAQLSLVWLSTTGLSLMAFLTSSSCLLFTASVAATPSSTFVIFFFPAFMPLSVTLGPPAIVKPSFVRITLFLVLSLSSFIVTPLLSSTVFPVVTLSKLVNFLAKATFKPSLSS